MTRTGNQTEQLRKRKQEVHQLRDEEEEERLAEVTEDAHLPVNTLSLHYGCERDTGGVREGVADEDRGRVAVVLEESERGCQEGNDDHCREDVVLDVVRVSAHQNVQNVDEQQRTRDHQRLR